MAEWFAEGYDAADTRANCDGLGYSIFPRPGVSSHRGYPLFNGGQTTLRVLRRACERERSRPAGDADLLAAADMVLEQARLRTTASGDAETLTFASGSGDEAILQPRAAAAEGAGKATARSGASLGVAARVAGEKGGDDLQSSRGRHGAPDVPKNRSAVRGSRRGFESSSGAAKWLVSTCESVVPCESL
eukprot:CAMPEP_0183585368 /NCGR_PEP_ID=MMETSP0371-20130417/155168_1 /TAXON_ID=268820 /ORGANISM="Peridinium aciculiferum, Strain PAER-2" /LENGTH=188 /DNA_ID=CAMNT_0025796337 /DNA_START=84 /DNA_END=651 /DNA_ORIENTATION=-